MVEAIIALKNGDVMKVYDESFETLFNNIDMKELDIVQVTGRTIKTTDMRQGKETLRNAQSV